MSATDLFLEYIRAYNDKDVSAMLALFDTGNEGWHPSLRRVSTQHDRRLHITGGRQTGSFAQSGGVSSFLAPAETGV